MMDGKKHYQVGIVSGIMDRLCLHGSINIKTSAYFTWIFDTITRMKEPDDDVDDYKNDEYYYLIDFFLIFVYTVQKFAKR